MTRITGNLQDISGAPSAVREIWVRPAHVRAGGGKITTTEPVSAQVEAGRVTIDVADGPATLTLVYQQDTPAPGHAAIESLPILVGAGMDLAAAVQAGRAADGADFDQLASLAQQSARNLAEARKVSAAAKTATADATRMLGEVEQKLREGLLDKSVYLKHLADETRALIDGKAAKSHTHHINQLIGVPGATTGVDSRPLANTIAIRDSKGRVKTATPAAADDAAPKSYVDSLLAPGDASAKVTAYAAGKARTIVARIHDGQIAVLEPVHNYHAAPKWYVDREIEKLRRALSGGGVVNLSPFRGMLLLVAGATCWLRISVAENDRAVFLEKLADFRIPEVIRPSWSAFGSVLHGGVVTVRNDGRVLVEGRDLQTTGGLYGQSMWVVEDKNAAKGWGSLPTAG